jgi:hypothetical protein
MNKLIDRRKDKWADQQIDKEANGQIDRWTKRHIDTLNDGRRDRYIVWYRIGRKDR